MKMLWGIPMRFQNVVIFQICSYVTVCLSYMMTPSNWNFSALLALCAGNSPVTGECPAQRPVTRGFDVFFDLRLNGRLSKQSWGWWFEKLLRPLWRHSNDNQTKTQKPHIIAGPLWGESGSNRWIPFTKSAYCGKCFHVMTSSWHSLGLVLSTNVRVRKISRKLPAPC